jgi:hypothetical protein
MAGSGGWFDRRAVPHPAVRSDRCGSEEERLPHKHATDRGAPHRTGPQRLSAPVDSRDLLTTRRPHRGNSVRGQGVLSHLHPQWMVRPSREPIGGPARLWNRCEPFPGCPPVGNPRSWGRCRVPKPHSSPAGRRRGNASRAVRVSTESAREERGKDPPRGTAFDEILRRVSNKY